RDHPISRAPLWLKLSRHQRLYLVNKNRLFRTFGVIPGYNRGFIPLFYKCKKGGFSCYSHWRLPFYDPRRRPKIYFDGVAAR
ncbi:MAG: hypothetical protein OWS74_06310, partial [Firmicutes bacterium]|nr:hypothetical protein [Bacillota bacterium]